MPAEHACTFKNTKTGLLNRIWHSTTCWQSDLLLHECSTLWIVFVNVKKERISKFRLKTRSFVDLGTNIAFVQLPLPHLHKHYINGCGLGAAGAKRFL